MAPALGVLRRRRIVAMGAGARATGSGAILREFEVQVTLWKRDHDPRIAIDWGIDFTDYPRAIGEKEPDRWAIYTNDASAAPVLGFSSSA